MVALAVASNQVLNSGVMSLSWLTAALVLALLTVWLDRRMSVAPAAPPAPQLRSHLAGPDGAPVLLGELSPQDLGAHQSKFDHDGSAPYVARELADEQLRAALTSDERRMVIVQGPRLAGCTRTLAHAATRLLANYQGAWFFDDPQVPLTAMLNQAGQWARQVPDDYQGPAMGAALWLERPAPSRYSELARLAADDFPDGVWVLATFDSDELDELRDRAHLDAALDALAVRISLATITEDERSDLQRLDVYAPLRPVLEQTADLYLGRLMVVWDTVRDAVTSGTGEHATDRIALLRAVTDWHRARLPRLLTDEILKYLYAAYRTEVTSTRPAYPHTGLKEALAWATTSVPSTSTRLGRPQLVTTQTVSGRRAYSPHPLLSALADDPTEAASWPVADILWAYADQFFDSPRRQTIARSALRHDAFQAAARLLKHPGTPADPEAFYTIAGRLQDEDPKTSRYWYRAAIDTGHTRYAPNAMADLGRLEEKQGRIDEARRWFQAAIDTGHTDAAPTAMHDLAHLEEAQERPNEARRWFQAAIDTGHTDEAPSAMFNLGHFERKQGRIDEARRWFQAAIDIGHTDEAPSAIFALAQLEAEHGRIDEAHRYYRAVLDTAKDVLRVLAMFNLASLELQLGRDDEALHLYEAVIDTGHTEFAPLAMRNLGDLEWKQGRIDEARRWYRAAINTGRTHFPSTNTGHLHLPSAPEAMVRLGLLELQIGRVDEARRWLHAAIEAGDADTVASARKELRRLNQHQDEQRRVQHFVRYGWQAWADPTLIGRHGTNAKTTDSANETDAEVPEDK
jgi:tetratricopeptide (TPR) repeat protein